MTTEVNEVLAVLKNRQLQYDFLQTVFSQPLSNEILQAWKNQTMDMNDYLQTFAVELASENVKEVVEKEKRNYLQLFFGPGSIPAPPWESIYRTKERLLFGEPTLKLREKLREFQLQYETPGNEPEDHISIELEFMSYLIQLAIDAIEHQDENEFVRSVNMQLSLLEEHLMKWVSSFTDDILTATTSSLYKGSALFLKEVINEDYQYMNEMKEVLGHE